MDSISALRSPSMLDSFFTIPTLLLFVKGEKGCYTDILDRKEREGEKPMAENYIFDLYGTLIDIETDEEQLLLWERLADSFQEKGACYEPACLKQRYRELVTAQEDLLAERSGVPRPVVEIRLEKVFAALLEEKAVQPKEEWLLQTGALFREWSTHYLRLFPEADGLLRRLHEAGKGVFLLSNAQRIFTMPEMKKLGIADSFDGILLSSDAGVKKPSPLFFSHLLEKYDIKKDTCVMVGNDCNADIGGAHDFGIPSIYIHTVQSTPLTHPLPADCRQIRQLWEVFP